MFVHMNHDSSWIITLFVFYNRKYNKSSRDEPYRGSLQFSSGHCGVTKLQKKDIIKLNTNFIYLYIKLEM